MLMRIGATPEPEKGAHRARWIDSDQARAIGFLACLIGAWVPFLLIGWLAWHWVG